LHVRKNSVWWGNYRTQTRLQISKDFQTSFSNFFLNFFLIFFKTSFKLLFLKRSVAKLLLEVYEYLLG